MRNKETSFFIGLLEEWHNLKGMGMIYCSEYHSAAFLVRKRENLENILCWYSIS